MVKMTSVRSFVLCALEVSCILFVPLLVGQVLWIWTLKRIDGQTLERPAPGAGVDNDSDSLTFSRDLFQGNRKQNPEEIKLLCIIAVPKFNESHSSPVDHIPASWGSGCTDTHYFEYIYNATDRLLKLREFYMAKSALMTEHPWIVHAHPGTYVILKNLKQMLSTYPHDVPVVIGSNAKVLILSNGFVRQILQDTSTTPAAVGRRSLFDYLFSGMRLSEQSLREYRVLYAKTTDEEGRMTFFEEFEKTLNGSILNFKTQLRLEKNIKYGSRHAIAFPNLNPPGFVAMDFLLHVLHVGPRNTTWTQTVVSASEIGREETTSLEQNQATYYEMADDELGLNYLAKEIKILCMILTGPHNHMRKALHVKRTWGRRCNTLVFLSSESDPFLKTVALPNAKEGREYLWQKMQLGFRYVYEHFRDKMDWFLKADDDTYVVMENLRMLLQGRDPGEPQYLGLRLKGNFTHPWATGGAGYAISNAGLKLLVENALSKPANETRCPIDLFDVPEDVFTSLCLHYLNIPYVDTRDEMYRQRFFQHTVKDMVNGDVPEFFYREYQYYPIAHNIGCCAPSSVSFHYIEPFQMYEMEYIVYDLNESGRHYYLNQARRRTS